MPGEDAATHYIDAMAAAGEGPMWLFALGVLVIAAVVAYKILPVVKECKLRAIDIEEQREQRKAEEARMRDERDRESAAINARAVDAQERSTAAITAMTQQMAVMSGQLEMSRDRSAHMGGQIDDMARKVSDIHGAVVVNQPPNSKE